MRGKTIKKLRKLMGITATEAASRMGTPRAHYSKVENRESVSTAITKKFSNMCGVSFEMLEFYDLELDKSCSMEEFHVKKKCQDMIENLIHRIRIESYK